MTCIVGMEYVEKGVAKVAIAGDLLGSNITIKMLYRQPKVFINNGVLFGICGDYAYGQILEHILVHTNVPTEANEVHRWLVRELIPAIRAAVGESSMLEGTMCLVGVLGQLWIMQEGSSILRSTCGYASIGSGSQFALGSLATSKEKNVVKKLQKAIEVSSIFCPTVSQESTCMVY